MVITRRQVSLLLDAHLNMDGSPTKPSKFGPKVRYSLAKNVRLLQTAFEDMEKSRIGLIKELAPTTNSIVKDSPEMASFSNRWNDFLDTTEDIRLMKFTLGELQLDVNDLPIAVLAKLGAVIVEDEDAPAK